MHIYICTLYFFNITISLKKKLLLIYMMNFKMVWGMGKSLNYIKIKFIKWCMCDKVVEEIQCEGLWSSKWGEWYKVDASWHEYFVNGYKFLMQAWSVGKKKKALIVVCMSREISMEKNLISMDSLIFFFWIGISWFALESTSTLLSMVWSKKK